MEGSLRDGKAAAVHGMGPCSDQTKSKVDQMRTKHAHQLWTNCGVDVDLPSQARINGSCQGQMWTNCGTNLNNTRTRCEAELAKRLSPMSTTCHGWWAASDGSLRDGKAAALLGDHDGNGQMRGGAICAPFLWLALAVVLPMPLVTQSHPMPSMPPPCFIRHCSAVCQHRGCASAYGVGASLRVCKANVWPNCPSMLPLPWPKFGARCRLLSCPAWPCLQYGVVFSMLSCRRVWWLTRR